MGKQERERRNYLVEIDFGDLVRDASPVGFSHVVADSPVGQELSDLEEVLLLLALRFLGGGRGRRRARVLGRRRRRSAKASEEVQ